jgi:hypothetical protein
MDHFHLLLEVPDSYYHLDKNTMSSFSSPFSVIKHPSLPFSVSPTHVIKTNGEKMPTDVNTYLLAAIFVKLDELVAKTQPVEAPKVAKSSEKAQ